MYILIPTSLLYVRIFADLAVRGDGTFRLATPFVYFASASQLGRSSVTTPMNMSSRIQRHLDYIQLMRRFPALSLIFSSLR